MTATMNEANDFLMGGGSTAAKFDTIGTTVSGQITTPPRVEQQKDFTTGEPKIWNDGKPMQQLVVTVATTLRDPDVSDDDGTRAFYIKANMLKAVREAVRKSGAKGLEVGGTLAVTYTADGESTKRGFNPPKIYSATYTPPAAAAAAEFLNAQQPAPAAAPQGAFVPASQGPAPQWATGATAQQPAAQAWTPPPGVSPEQAAALAVLTPEQRAALGITG